MLAVQVLVYKGLQVRMCVLSLLQLRVDVVCGGGGGLRGCYRALSRGSAGTYNMIRLTCKASKCFS